MDQLLRIARLAVVAVAVTVINAGTAATANAAKGEDAYASGIAGPCVPLKPQAVRDTECDGVAVLTGKWVGTLKFHARGWADPVSGDAGGFIIQRFTGRYDFGRRGVFRMRGPFTVEGDTGEGRALLQIEGISGAFARATGQVEVWALMPVTGGPQIVQYVGTWFPQGE